MAELWGTGPRRSGWVTGVLPACGEDFCDTCGDCLYCYDDTEWCLHRWVVYEDKLDDFLRAHPGAEVQRDIAANSPGGQP